MRTRWLQNPSTCDFAHFSYTWDLMYAISFFLSLFFFSPPLDQIFGAIESDDTIGFPVGGSSQNINVSEGQGTLYEITLCPLKA